MVQSTLFHLPDARQGRLAHSSIKLLVALQILLVTLVVAGVYLISLHLRSLALDNMSAHAQTQTHTKEERLTQNFSLLQTHLRSLFSDSPEAVTNPDALRNSLLGLQQKLLYIRSLSVMDSSGKILVSTQPANEQLQLELGPLLPAVKADTADLLRFGTPWNGRDFARGQRLTTEAGDTQLRGGFIPVTLILPDVPQWTLVVAINSDYFINIAPEHREPGEMAFRAFMDDGTLLFSTSAFDRPGSRPLPAERLAEIHQQHITSSRWHDGKGVLQLSAYRASRSYPLFVQSVVSSDHILKKWRTDTLQLWLATGATLAIMLFISGWLTLRARRTLEREERSLEENRLAASVFLHSSDMIIIANSEKKIIAVNPAYEKITGYQASEALGKMHWRIAAGNDNAAQYNSLWAKLEAGSSWQGEVIEHHHDGSQITGWLQVNCIRDSSDQVLNYIGVFKDLSRLRESEATVHKLSLALEQSPSSIVMTTPDAEIEYANPEFLKSSGYNEEEVLGANPRILQSGQTPMQTYMELWGKISQGQVWYGEFINKRKDGSIYYESSSISPVLDTKGNLTGYLGIKHDVTAEKEAQRTMRLAASVIASTAECVLICDADRLIIEVNPAFCRLTGYSSEEVLGRSPAMLYAENRNDEACTAMLKSLETADVWQGEFWNRHKNGSLYIIAGTVNLLRDDEGNITHYISVFSDITEEKQHQENLQKQAHFDPLTGLPNRALLHVLLEQAITRSRRQHHWFAVCFMDLDGFKKVNDTLGHAAGDELLICIAERLKKSLRNNDTVARIGGDEFILLLSPVSCLEECDRIATRILEAVAAPVTIGEHEALVTGSMGITLYPLDSGNSEQLLRHADRAMYEAKHSGRNRYVLSNKMTLGGSEAGTGTGPAHWLKNP